MSVCLKEFRDPSGTVELMAPDYDKARFWLWDEYGQRVDLSVKQAKELRDTLNEILPR